MTSPAVYVGIMSGTSLDGIDVAVAAIDGGQCRLLASGYSEYDDEMRSDLLALQDRCDDELHRVELAGIALSRLYAGAVNALIDADNIERTRIRAIGCHGQTIRHRPDAGYSKQIFNPALLAELTGLSVVADFRNRDIAAGGQGAPLVPAFHAAVFGTKSSNRVVCNIGGIANLTCIPHDGPITGFDSGPGNVLMDAWIARQKGKRYDRDGAWAASGQVIDPLLAQLLENPYFDAPPPKSTGREAFNPQLLERYGLQRYAPADVQATLSMLTAATIADAALRWGGRPEALYVCGGGAHNTHLLSQLRMRLPKLETATTATLGIDPDWVEALAFAWLAYRTLNGLPGNVPSVTGAQGERVLGAVYPA